MARGGDVMAVNNCTKCGGKIRLGAHRVSLNRRRGVYHYLAHMTGDCDTTKGWDCSMLKPYPEAGETPREKMVERWNEANPND